MINAAKAKELTNVATNAEYQRTMESIEKQIETATKAGKTECHFGVIPIRIREVLTELGYKVTVNSSIGETNVSW